MKRILLIGCGGSAGFNFVESLRLADEEYFIVGTDVNEEHLELSNCDEKYLVPKNSDNSYIETINKIIKKENIDFVHIQPDKEVAFWSGNRSQLEGKFLLPSERTVSLCHDKILFNKTLKEAGVAVPESYKLSKDTVEKVFSQLSTGENKIWVRAIRGSGSRASLPIVKLEHAKMWIDYWVTMRGTALEDFMMAEFLPGREFAFQSIWKDGTLITSQARERKEYVFGNIMPSGQSSSPSVAMSVSDERVNTTATDAIMAVDEKPDGIYCVDMKENSKGIPCVTEINIGRFFTTNDFFSKAGVNMPHWYIKSAFGEPLPKMDKYNPLKKELLWLRIIDMGKKLMENGKWTYKKI